MELRNIFYYDSKKSWQPLLEKKIKTPHKKGAAPLKKNNDKK